MTVSTTGIATPSLEARTFERMGFRPDIRRIPVFGLGCAGGVNGLATASRLAAAEPGSHWLMVTVETSPGGLTVEIQDDGPGFDLDEALTRSQRRGRLGLIGMRERADLLGASLAIDSAPGAGTTIRLTVPLTEKGPSQA